MFFIALSWEGLAGWYIARRNESVIVSALKAQKPEQGLDTAEVCNLLGTATKTLSDHSDVIDRFERLLDNANDRQADVSMITGIRQANRSVEQAIESTIEGLIATCDDVLCRQPSSGVAYQENMNPADTSQDRSMPDEFLVQIASTLLEMVRELRDENKIVQNEVAAGKDHIIQLLGRASCAEQRARVDILTELPNRHALNEAHSQCKSLQHQTGQPFSLIMLDIDHFKAVNDKFGHAAGDAILIMVARVLRENSKTGDLTCRLGGEEFAVLLPRCTERSAVSVAERYRNAIGSAVLRHEGHEITVTVSCGVAQAISNNTQADLLSRADIALYCAKSEGRNQTCVDGDLEIDRESRVAIDRDLLHAESFPTELGASV